MASHRDAKMSIVNISTILLIQNTVLCMISNKDEKMAYPYCIIPLSRLSLCVGLDKIGKDDGKC